MQHGDRVVLTPEQIAQIPGGRLRAIVAAGVVEESLRQVEEIEAGLLVAVTDDDNDERVE